MNLVMNTNVIHWSEDLLDNGDLYTFDDFS